MLLCSLMPPYQDAANLREGLPFSGKSSGFERGNPVSICFVSRETFALNAHTYFHQVEEAQRNYFVEAG